jgi:signal transduction histidine kinase
MPGVWRERFQLNQSRQSQLLWAACGVLVALLAWIAVLQYRWINRASHADRRQREELLVRSVRDFRLDFAEALYEPALFFRRSADVVDVENDLAELMAEWRNATNHPQLLRAVSFGVEDASGDTVFKRRRLDETQFTQQPWPEELARYRNVAARGVRPEFAPALFLHGFAGELVAGQPVIVFPLSAGAHGRGGMRHQAPFAEHRPELKGWGFLELDAAYLQTQLIPELMERHFDRDGLDECQLAVINGQPPRILVQSDAADTSNAASLPDKFGPVDARTTIFGNRQQGLPEFLMSGRAAADRLHGRHVPPGRLGRPLPETLIEPEESDAWQLVVKYKSGSLAEAVEHARRHNLALSLGALLILAGSIALLAVATQRARRLAQQQMEFIAGASHELRTPLAVIQSTSFNLARGTVSDASRVQQYGVAIQNEVRRLATQVEQMLSFAGIQSGRQLYDLRPVDAGEIVKHALSAFAPSLAEQDWQVETDIACDLPPAIADAQALESAVKNLIQNAMKYASEGKSLGIRVEADQAAKQIKITVADCGEGIDPTDLPHIFQPFYRGKKVLASPIGGAGLGLSLVDRHLRAMRGRVTVTTSPQTGTAFTLHLPAQNKIE